MSTRFNPGDVVRIKSGGPAMTIESLSGEGAFCQWNKRYATHLCRCVWYDPTEGLLHAAFNEHALEPCDADQYTPPTPYSD